MTINMAIDGTGSAKDVEVTAASLEGPALKKGGDKLPKKGLGWVKSRPPRIEQMAAISGAYLAAIGLEVSGGYFPNAVSNNFIIQAMLAKLARSTIKGSLTTVPRSLRHAMTTSVALISIGAAVMSEIQEVKEIALAYGLGPLLDGVSKEIALGIKGISYKGKGPELPLSVPIIGGPMGSFLEKCHLGEVVLSDRVYLYMQKAGIAILCVTAGASSSLPLPLLAKATVIDATADALGTFFRTLPRTDRYLTLVTALTLTGVSDAYLGLNLSALSSTLLIRSATKTVQFWMRGSTKDAGSPSFIAKLCKKHLESTADANDESKIESDDDEEGAAKKPTALWKQGLVTALAIGAAVAPHFFLDHERMDVKLAEVALVGLASSVTHTFLKNVAGTWSFSLKSQYALLGASVAGGALVDYTLGTASLLPVFAATLLKTLPKDCSTYFKGKTVSSVMTSSIKDAPWQARGRIAASEGLAGP